MARSGVGGEKGWWAVDEVRRGRVCNDTCAIAGGKVGRVCCDGGIWGMSGRTHLLQSLLRYLSLLWLLATETSSRGGVKIVGAPPSSQRRVEGADTRTLCGWRQNRGRADVPMQSNLQSFPQQLGCVRPPRCVGDAACLWGLGKGSRQGKARRRAKWSLAPAAAAQRNLRGVDPCPSTSERGKDAAWPLWRKRDLDMLHHISLHACEWPSARERAPFSNLPLRLSRLHATWPSHELPSAC